MISYLNSICCRSYGTIYVNYGTSVWIISWFTLNLHNEIGFEAGREMIGILCTCNAYSFIPTKCLSCFINLIKCALELCYMECHAQYNSNNFLHLVMKQVIYFCLYIISLICTFFLFFLPVALQLFSSYSQSSAFLSYWMLLISDIVF